MLDNINLFCIVDVSLTFMEATIAKYNNNAPVSEDDGPRIKSDIKAKEVRLIDENGENKGVVALRQALVYADEAGLDLIEISPQAVPPVCKIMDYGKYKYEQKKRASEARKKQKTIELKEVWVKPFIEENDLNIKMKKVFEFLDEGNKVKIAIMTKGAKKVLARGRDAIPQLFAHIVELVGERGTLESKSKPDERTKSIIIAPAK